MSYGTDMMLPLNLNDFIKAREVVLMKWEQAHRLVADADEAMKRVYEYGLGYKSALSMSMDEMTRDVDRKLWDKAFRMTGFMRLMDAEAVREFRNELDNNPPVFNEDNIRSTFLSAAQDADMMFARGLVNVFLRLHPSLQMNNAEPFKVNRRAALGWMIEQGGVRAERGAWRSCLRVSYRSSATEKINDIDRVFKVLDGKEHNPGALADALNAALASVDGNNTYEDDYYKMRAFKNGNLHITFKREDLLDKANRIISDYYNGSALAAGGAKHGR